MNFLSNVISAYHQGIFCDISTTCNRYQEYPKTQEAELKRPNREELPHRMPCRKFLLKKEILVNQIQVVVLTRCEYMKGNCSCT